MDDETLTTRPLWVEDTRGLRRMPDPVRNAAVRAVMFTSVTIILALVAFLTSVTGSWLAYPTTIAAVAATVVATWSVLDIWITRQVWRQRNGVVSEPSSSAYPASRRERVAEEWVAEERVA
ncbi:hypothetical protein [Streptomyces sp. NPDC093105]|uniref:hypothetical protein n=1 Tax=Streptomyces sp. NPDC093105 TaxID=3366029 RepID=UPI0038250516